MKAIVNAYKDKGDANGVKQVQSTGLHVAGERFVVLKADERSLYGKKVRFPFSSFSAGRWTWESLVNHKRDVEPGQTRKQTMGRHELIRIRRIGQRGHRHRQNHTSHPRHALSGRRTARLGCEHGRAAW